MVREVRRGATQRAVARKYRVSLATVQRWVKRAQDQRLNRVDWEDRPPIPKKIFGTPKVVEDRILDTREHLKKFSDLGEYGADAIHRKLIEQNAANIPSVRTIGRILVRRGALDGKKRIRRPAPPPGWYLPDVAKGRAELDSFDVVEDLVIRGGIHVDVLNGISLHGGIPGSWPMERVSARAVVEKMIEHWLDVGLPQYAQFDNDTRFQGAHHRKDSFSRVMRLCFGLGIIPVFVPPQESGFQANIENYNGRWESKVWRRFLHQDIPELVMRSDRYVIAYRKRIIQRIDSSPPRSPFPSNWTFDLQARPQGQMVYIRRTSDKGTVFILGHTIMVDERWPHRLIRCEIDLQRKRMCFFRLRRKDPGDQPCLGEIIYSPREKEFRERFRKL